MTEQEVLSKLIEIVDPLDEITVDTVIEDCEDLDSLALFNVVIAYKPLGIILTLQEFSHCKTVGDIVKLILSKQA